MVNKKSESQDVDPWKYVVLTGFILILTIGLLQITPFGIVYGKLLARIGNEVQDTSTVHSVFSMMLLGAGLPANQLLQKFSYRKVAFIGATIFCTGSFLSAFVTSAIQLVFTFGVLQGLGWGLLVSSAFVVFTEYFNTRRNFYMNVAHLITSTITISFPMVSMLSVNYYGNRETILLIAAVSSHVIFAASCFQPIKWHAKSKATLPIELFIVETEALTKVKKKSLTKDVQEISFKTDSIILNWCKTVYKSFDLALFKDPAFVNTAIGVSLAQSSDMMYISFLPLLLGNAGFTDQNVSLLMTVYVVSDLVGKIFLCVLTAFVKVKSRYLVLIGATGMATFRLAQTLSHAFGWVAVICSLLGFVRSLVENTASLVFAETFPERLVTSYSLGMVVNALVVFLLGQIIRVITSVTNNKEVILIVLSMSAAGCAVPWAIVLSYNYLKRKIVK